MNLLNLLLDDSPTDESLTFTFTVDIVSVVTPSPGADTGAFAESSSVADVTPALTGSEFISFVDACSLAVAVTVADNGTSVEIASPLIPPDFSPIVGDSASGRETASLTRLAWAFTPPTRDDLFQIENSLFVTIREGVSVLKTGGAYKLISTPLPEDIEAADIAYLGGRSYTISDAEKVNLISAGYGAYLSLISLPG